MKKEQLFASMTELDDQLLEQYFAMDQGLARKHARKKAAVRMTLAAACVAVLLCVCVPAGMMVAHPAGRAVLRGDSEALTEQLNNIEGFKPWQEQTAQKLEQSLPGPVWELLQTTPIVNVLTQSQYPAYAMKDATFAPATAGAVEPGIMIYFLDDKSGFFPMESMIDAAPAQYADDTAAATFVLAHEGASYELKYAYSVTQSLARQAVHVYELHNGDQNYTAYLDVNAGTCIYWSSPERADDLQAGASEQDMEQRAYSVLADCVRDPEAYELLTRTENGTFVYEYVRSFGSTFPGANGGPVNLSLRSCDRAVFTFDAAGNMVGFDLAYLGALRNAEKTVPGEIYALAENYFRSTFRGKDELVRDVHDNAYVVVITPNGGLALSHEFSLDLVYGTTASMGYLVPMESCKSEGFYEIEQVDDDARVLLVSGTSDGDTFKYAYDQSGNLIETVRLVSGIADQKTVYTYDQKGQMIKQEVFDAQGELISLYSWEYDDAGRLVFEHNGKYDCENTYTYGQDGSYVVQKKSLFDQSVIKTEVTLSKDAAGNVIAENQYESGVLVKEIVYEYDSEGRLIKQEERFADGVVERNVYEYVGNKKITRQYRGGLLIFELIEHYNQYGEVVFSESLLIGPLQEIRWTSTNEYGYLAP